MANPPLTAIIGSGFFILRPIHGLTYGARGLTPWDGTFSDGS